MITPQMEKLLDYLGRAEGTNIHRNPTESDITAGYGIYKVAHPNAEIFQYISSMVMAINVPRHTEDWNTDHINMVNAFLNSSPVVVKELRKLAAKFYENYYKGANLQLFPEESVLAMVSMYTTSSQNANKAVQRAVNECIKNNFISHRLLVDDGDFGPNTKSAMQLIFDARRTNGPFFGYMFEDKIIRYMTMIYDDLCYLNKEKYGRYRNGWRDRMNKLAESRE